MYWIFEIETLHTMLADCEHVHNASVNQFNLELKAEVLKEIRGIESELKRRAQPFTPFVS